MNLDPGIGPRKRLFNAEAGHDDCFKERHSQRAAAFEHGNPQIGLHPQVGGPPHQQANPSTSYFQTSEKVPNGAAGYCADMSFTAPPAGVRNARYDLRLIDPMHAHIHRPTIKYNPIAPALQHGTQPSWGIHPLPNSQEMRPTKQYNLHFNPVVAHHGSSQVAPLSQPPHMHTTTTSSWLPSSLFQHEALYQSLTNSNDAASYRKINQQSWLSFADDTLGKTDEDIREQGKMVNANFHANIEPLEEESFSYDASARMPYAPHDMLYLRHLKEEDRHKAALWYRDAGRKLKTVTPQSSEYEKIWDLLFDVSTNCRQRELRWYDQSYQQQQIVQQAKALNQIRQQRGQGVSFSAPQPQHINTVSQYLTPDVVHRQDVQHPPHRAVARAGLTDLTPGFGPYSTSQAQAVQHRSPTSPQPSQVFSIQPESIQSIAAARAKELVAVQQAQLTQYHSTTSSKSLSTTSSPPVIDLTREETDEEKHAREEQEKARASRIEQTLATAPEQYGYKLDKSGKLKRGGVEARPDSDTAYKQNALHVAAGLGLSSKYAWQRIGEEQLQAERRSKIYRSAVHSTPTPFFQPEMPEGQIPTAADFGVLPNGNVRCAHRLNSKYPAKCCIEGVPFDSRLRNWRNWSKRQKSSEASKTMTDPNIVAVNIHGETPAAAPVPPRISNEEATIQLAEPVSKPFASTSGILEPLENEEEDQDDEVPSEPASFEIIDENEYAEALKVTRIAETERKRAEEQRFHQELQQRLRREAEMKQIPGTAASPALSARPSKRNKARYEVWTGSTLEIIEEHEPQNIHFSASSRSHSVSTLSAAYETPDTDMSDVPAATKKRKRTEEEADEKAKKGTKVPKTLSADPQKSKKAPSGSSTTNEAPKKAKKPQKINLKSAKSQKPPKSKAAESKSAQPVDMVEISSEQKPEDALADEDYDYIGEFMKELAKPDTKMTPTNSADDEESLAKLHPNKLPKLPGSDAAPDELFGDQEENEQA
ncbi:hypothetical protein BDV96DRAFT_655902 [Lophiotrema nucula]|uniref:Uncharacterized protein n=1 Tax=Lophiotrema nucula TaxID=690887 RepID=A0A6A5YE74_9PLEO|nr:hypothetical protein BDV96DRAFT_655902 [Lophiotrema nucula]